MTDSFNSIRTQLDLIPYGGCQDYMYVKSASFEPCYLSDDLDAVIRLYKEAGFWGNAWDFTKNLGLSTVGLADDKYRYLNYVTPIALAMIPGVGLGAGAVRAGVGTLARTGIKSVAKKMLGNAVKGGLSGGLKTGVKDVAQQSAKNGVKQIVRRRGGRNALTNMDYNTWAQGFKGTKYKNIVPVPPKPPVVGASNVTNVANAGIQGANAAVNGAGQVANTAAKQPGFWKTQLGGAGTHFGQGAWNGMTRAQIAGDITKGMLWGGSKNHLVNWGSWAVPYLASNFTDNKYLNNWATARTNLGYISPGMNRLSGWGANKVRAYRGTPRVPGAKPLVTPPPVQQSPHVQGATTFSSNPSFALDNPASSTYALQMPLDMSNPRMMAYLEPRWGW